MNIKAHPPAYRFHSVIAFACLGVFLLASRVEAQTWEFKLTPSKEGLCTVQDQSAKAPITVHPGDEIVVQVKNYTSTKQFLRWRGVTYHSQQGTTATAYADSRRFYSLQKPIGKGETFTYRWKMEDEGTLEYDCRLAAEQVI